MGDKAERTAEPGLGELFERLVGDVRSVAYAEADLLQATYWVRLRGALVSLGFIVAGAILCLAAFAALLVGLVLGLAPVIGPFTAALAVGGGAAAAGAGVVVFAAKRLDQQVSALGSEEADDDRAEEAVDGD